MAAHAESTRSLMSGLVTRALLTVCVAVLASHSATAVPENIAVNGVRPAKIGDYRQTARLFRRFAAIPEKDRPDLSFGLTGVLEPGDRPVQEAMPYLATKIGNVPLFRQQGDEMVFPRDDALWMENPSVMAPLAKSERIRLRFVFHIRPPERPIFSDETARHWLSEFDASSENVIGFIGALLIPDAHRLMITLAPNARFSVREKGASRDLAVSGSHAPDRYTFRPQDFSHDAVFSSNRAIPQIDLVVPFDLKTEWRR